MNRIFRVGHVTVPVCRTLATVFISGAVNQSMAAEAIFGFTLGAPVDAPICAGDIVPAHPKEGYCFVRPKTASGAQDAGRPSLVQALFKYNDLPFWTGSRLELLVVNGMLEGVIASTGGRTTHMSVTSDLHKRFGQPTSVAPLQAQNSLGASFDGAISMWTVGDLVVTYTPIFGDLRRGKVDAFTPTGLKAWKQALDTPAPARPL